MLDRIEKLLVRKLRGVFGERDPARRATAIEVIFDRDCLFSDARRRHVGHRELEDTVVALQVQFRDHTFCRSAALTPRRTAGGSTGRLVRPTNRGGSPDWTSPS
jgi:hypothetical protein